MRICKHSANFLCFPSKHYASLIYKEFTVYGLGVFIHMFNFLPFQKSSQNVSFVEYNNLPAKKRARKTKFN